MNLIANDTTLRAHFTLSGGGRSNSQVCITIISLHEFQKSMSNVIVSILILDTVAAKFARFVHIAGSDDSEAAYLFDSKRFFLPKCRSNSETSPSSSSEFASLYEQQQQ